MISGFGPDLILPLFHSPRTACAWLLTFSVSTSSLQKDTLFSVDWDSNSENCDKDKSLDGQCCVSSERMVQWCSMF